MPCRCGGHAPLVHETERAVLDRYVNAWQRQDLGALLDCYADDFTLHYMGDSPLAGTHRGRDAAVAVLAEASQRATRTLLGVDDVMVGDGCGAVVVRERLERDGGAHELRRVLRYRIDEVGLRECWLLDEDQALVDRLWS